jgi:hypothetical protein
MVDFLLTFRCPSKCRHCCYKAGPERSGCIRIADADEYLKEVIDTQPLQSVGAHGGEPFLHFVLLKHIVKRATELGVPRTWVITNGFWAETGTMAQSSLAELKEAGLTSITFSVDGFHQEYIPLETVRNGIEAAISVGLETVNVDSYYLGSPESDNSFNASTRDALESLKDLDRVEFHSWQADCEGRGAELATHIESREAPPTGKCRLPFWIGGDLKNPEAVEIDCEGNVTLCPGVCIGNTRRTPLGQILQSYNCSEHPILSIIAEEGPIGLVRIAETKGFKRHREFVDECHLCYEMRKLLRPHYPQHLAPEHCY